MNLEDLEDNLETSSYSEDFELEEDSDIAPDMTGMIFTETDDDEPIEKIELDTPVEEITIVDTMPDEVKEAITKFNSRTSKLRDFMKDLKEDQEQEEINSSLDDSNDYDYDDESEDEDENNSFELENNVESNEVNVDDLEDFL